MRMGALKLFAVFGFVFFLCVPDYKARRKNR